MREKLQLRREDFQKKIFLSENNHEFLNIKELFEA